MKNPTNSILIVLLGAVIGAFIFGLSYNELPS